MVLRVCLLLQEEQDHLLIIGVLELLQLLLSTAGLCAGPFTVTVTDANGCTATTSVTISAPTALNLINHCSNECSM